MRKKSSHIRLAAAFAILAFIPLNQVHAQDQGYSVMELFTSQGCPSCPPADRILKSITEHYGRNVITLGCHVTYFNRGRFDDPMSKIWCDARQEAYRESGVTSHMYTPQVVINGHAEAVGNNESQVMSAIKNAGPVPPLGLAKREGYLDISLPEMNLRGPAEIWLFAYGAPDGGQITGGPNAGKMVSYEHPVMNLTKLLKWDGRHEEMSFPLDKFHGEGYAIVAQDAGDAGIIAAGKTN